VPALVLAAFLAVPLIELYVILQVAHVIGGWQTLAVLIAESLIGTWLVRREGRRSWRAFSAAVEAHRPPAREVADGVLVVIGGTLLLTPGFVTDVVGFFFLLPFTRPLARRLLLRTAGRRVGRRLGFGGAAVRGWGRTGGAGREQRPRWGHPSGPGQRPGVPPPGGPVIEGEVQPPTAGPDQPGRGPDGPNPGTGPGQPKRPPER
jgi:UPF0716 protein FxsA